MRLVSDFTGISSLLVFQLRCDLLGCLPPLSVQELVVETFTDFDTFGVGLGAVKG